MNETATDGMTVRRITLADGRYMIFYRFSWEILKLRQEVPLSREKQEPLSAQTGRESGV
jgi:hypothetical protein